MSANDYSAWSWTPGAGIDGLKPVRLPLPTPGPDEVLVANTAVALNPVDWKMIDWGRDDWQQGQVPGVDGVGIVMAVGDEVNLRVGARVAYHQSLTRGGSFAEYALLRARAVYPVPDSLDDASAASLPCPGLTAWQALDKLPTCHNRDVLVTGAGGAVGYLLAQLALQRGLRVWVTASAKHREHLLQLGVAGVFDYRDGQWTQQLREALGPRRLHGIFDTVSGNHAASLAPLLGYNGHLVCIQDRQESAPLPAFSTAISLHEVALNSIHAHGEALDWQELHNAAARLMQDVANGQLQAPAKQFFAFAELPAALRRLKSGEGTGKWISLLPAPMVVA
ncbi:zinc-binding dehydrogenase [Pseudomonas nitroreducens]|uniref:zinc-binding dehydrogenase n=1 Tax=Pseudomonas nitroreducens TaxID=46680 RepID=UPI0026594D16|nr:zinc-binding dehydrogenase [Pseudomonas nitroreducens]MCP1649695.1 NADPH:quinone reductase-like Zn-dependent oxidoreductase [Pseudomonas nitroreducens]MCP1687577.1 NADPH:quinone reductase-like Zn-dependent oxidoreductase [Pseudomonas nitroreducens]